jgi:uncharacterized membrane protein
VTNIRCCKCIRQYWASHKQSELPVCWGADSVSAQLLTRAPWDATHKVSTIKHCHYIRERQYFFVFGFIHLLGALAYTKMPVYWSAVSETHMPHWHTAGYSLPNLL